VGRPTLLVGNPWRGGHLSSIPLRILTIDRAFTTGPTTDPDQLRHGAGPPAGPAAALVRRRGGGAPRCARAAPRPQHRPGAL